MNQQQTYRRAFVAVLFALATISMSPFLFSTSVEAADCGNAGGPHSLIEVWLSTPAAQIRTDGGDCDDEGPNLICKEMCLTLCYETTPQNVFGCFEP